MKNDLPHCLIYFKPTHKTNTKWNCKTMCVTRAALMPQVCSEHLHDMARTLLKSQDKTAQPASSQGWVQHKQERTGQNTGVGQRKHRLLSKANTWEDNTHLDSQPRCPQSYHPAQPPVPTTGLVRSVPGPFPGPPRLLQRVLWHRHLKSPCIVFKPQLDSS